MSPVAAVSFRGVQKNYGGLQALKGIDLEISAGVVHSIVGANGAGKSTLIKVLAGLERPDAGQVEVRGRRLALTHPSGAAASGLGFVHQELNLVPKFTGTQNIALGAMPGKSRGGFMRWGAIERRATELLKDLHPSPIDLRRPVEDLSVTERWMISLCRTLIGETDVIALDEPTASFTDENARNLYSAVERLRSQGKTIIYVSHRLDEVKLLSDEITVMRDGRVIRTGPAGDLTVETIRAAIVGDVVAQDAVTHTPPEGREMVLVLSGVRRDPVVKDAALSIAKGEILGIAGLAGSGRSELARLIVGADRQHGGHMTLHGKSYRPRSPHDAMREGVVLVPEERRSEGLLLDRSVSFNVTLSSLEQSRALARVPYLSTRHLRRRAQQAAIDFEIKTSSPDQQVWELSGGNQQKVLMARCLATKPAVLVLDEPTVGVDVGAREGIYNVIRAHANQGTSVIMIASDFDELRICDRVVVMRAGRIERVVEKSNINKATLTALCYGQG